MSPSSAKRRAARSRRGKRPASKVSVMPVVITSNAASEEAVIPVSVKSGADSAEAVIPVQVSGRGKGVRKRAAVIPVAVQKRRARKPKARGARPRPRPAQVEAARREFPRPWRTFVADQLDGFVQVEQDIVQVAKEYSQTAVAFVRWLVLPPASRPASGRAPQRATILAWRSPQTQPARRRAA